MKQKLLKIFYIIFSLFFINSLLFSQQSNSTSIDFNYVFNSKLTQQEKSDLQNKKVVIKNIHKLSNISLNNFNDSTDNLFNQLTSLKPNYLAEIIKIVPYKNNENIIEKLDKVLCDISSYKGIPYYSEHNKIWVDLYSDAKILSSKIQPNKKEISAYFYMIPFNEIYSDILINSTIDQLFYSNTNSSPIKYDKIVCVKKNKMCSFIIVFKNNDYWILYGIGGVNAPKLPFLTKRIELSFMNRIKTFCNFAFDKLD